MEKSMYTVYDTKAAYHGTPFPCLTDADAVRAFSGACSDRSSLIGVHPTDFTLYCIGVYNDSSAEFVSIKPRYITNGAEVIASANHSFEIQSTTEKDC